MNTSGSSELAEQDHVTPHRRILTVFLLLAITPTIFYAPHLFLIGIFALVGEYPLPHLAIHVLLPIAGIGLAAWGLEKRWRWGLPFSRLLAVVGLVNCTSGLVAIQKVTATVPEQVVLTLYLLASMGWLLYSVRASVRRQFTSR